MFNEFDITKAEFNPFSKISKEWFLITAGDIKSLNTMTASWGGMGIMWNKNVATVVVRPQRKTLEFLNSSDYFTISFYDEEHRDILKYCGSHSGHNEDKITNSGLVPVAIDSSVTFEQASITLVCKKLFVQQLDKDCFIDKSLLSNYPNKDYHYSIVGEIVKAIKKD